MNRSLDESDQPLLQNVRSGNSDAWAEVVSQYQGRLTAFARRRLHQRADADDVVQETFLSLLKSLDSFRGESSLETWLFQLLRRRIADAHRRAGRDERVQLCLSEMRSEEPDRAAADRITASTDQSASWYVRREEQQQHNRTDLLRAVIASTDRLKAESRFRDLKAFDLLFFAQWKNQEIARELALEETAVAVLKHRFIQRISKHLPDEQGSNDSVPGSSDLLTAVWEAGRPSCPKRTTLGKYVLGTLTEHWDDFVSFHVERLGCQYCAANLDDVSAEINAATDGADVTLRGRIMESTIGFLNQCGAFSPDR